MNIIYTVCNRTNLAHALALADSVLQYQSDHIFYLAMVDSVPAERLPLHVRPLLVSELAIPGWERMAAEYFDFELLPACRPWFALELLRRHPECRQLTFLAPTVVLKKSINNVFSSDHEVYLTPNISAPLKRSGILDDKRILNAGMFHSGSWAVRPSEKITQMLEWWAARTVDRAKFDLCNGMNTDQLWLNYVPVWIPSHQTVYHAGWHYGLNAVLNRTLSAGKEGYRVDGQPLISLDFAGLCFFDPIWSDHAALLKQNQTFEALFNDYKLAVRDNQKQFPMSGQPAFGKVVPISKNRVMRNGIASKLKALSTFIDQF